MLISGKQNKMYKKIVSRKNVLLFLVLLTVVSLFEFNSIVKSKNYNNLYDFISTVVSNYKNSWDAKPETISIEIKDKDFKKLEKNRKQALERGVIINDMDGDYVSAVIEYNGKKINSKLRLKGHMTDHLQNNKWSFRVKIKENDETFMGMKRFSLQHPGTRGYIYEWLYHELMKREDVIALRYKFINVKVNGDDWGIYAVEENFENELLANNNRLTGPIIRFNPDLYWVNRYNEYQRINSFDEFASYYSANPEAYREEKVLKDSVQKEYYLKAIALIEGLRSKQISVDVAFDIPRLAKFHAIIDLVGGVHSIDWSDIKYYYNPVTAKLEPVAYESFTVLNSKNISSQYKFVSLDSSANYEDWHSMIFSDKTFFKEYIKQVERICSADYLTTFFDESNKELKNNLAIIYKEFPYKKFDKEDYFKRVKQIQRVLNPPKAVHAYLQNIENNIATVQVAAIDALPVEIKSIQIDGNNYKLSEDVILPSKKANSFLVYTTVKFKLNADFVWKASYSDSLKINYSILGSSLNKEVKLFPFPHTDSEFINEELKNKKSTIENDENFIVDEKTKMIQLKSNKTTISNDVVVPAGYVFFVRAGAVIDFKKKAKLISYSPLSFIGNVDFPITVTSSDSSSQGIEIINSEKSILSYVVFKGFPIIADFQWKRSGTLTFYESEVEIKNCSFYNFKSEDVINVIRSKFLIQNCLFQNCKNDGFDADFSEGTIEGCAFEDCIENAIDITKSKVLLKSIYISGSMNKGLNFKDGSEIIANDLKIKNSYIGVSAEDYSLVKINDIELTNNEYGLVSYKNKPSAGHADITVVKIKLVNVKKDYLKERKSLINIDGAEIKEDINDVELIIKKNGKKKK